MTCIYESAIQSVFTAIENRKELVTKRKPKTAVKTFLEQTRLPKVILELLIA